MRDYEECRPYIDHLVAEHRRLHKLISSMRAEIAQSAGPDGHRFFAEVKRILNRLRDELCHHFAQEEAGGCMDEAVSRCPRLSGEARRIEAEHPRILAQIDRLIAQTDKHPANADSRAALQETFAELCRQLHAHERAENELLQEGFGMTVNGDDDSQPALAYHI